MARSADGPDWARAGGPPFGCWWSWRRSRTSLGYVLDLSCRAQGWRTPERYEHLCYTDIAPLYSLRGFADGLLPYIQAMPDGQHLEYPVLTGAFMQVASLITSGVTAVFATTSKATVFFDVNVIMLFVAFVVTVVATALTVRRRPWDAAMVALAPTMILAATVNWDLLPLAFIAVALLLWSRKHPFAAGLLLGLAVAAKFYPVLLLGGFLLLTIRTAKWRAFGLLVAGTAVAWLVTNVPFMVANFEGWSYFYRFSQTRGEDFGSIWFALTQAGLDGVPADQLNLVATGSFLLLCVGIAWLTLGAPRRPRLAAVLFLIVAAFVLTNKVYSPQYSLWLVPLAVMARPRWRDFLIWQAGEVVYFAAIWWFLVGYGIDDTTGLTGQEYTVAIVIHVLVTVYFAAMVVQDMLAPHLDPVRNDGFDDDADDPGGGVFDGAPDVVQARPSTASNRDVVNRTSAAMRSPTAGIISPLGSQIIETCWCGGSANQRCLPAHRNGDRAPPGGVERPGAGGDDPLAHVRGGGRCAAARCRATCRRTPPRACRPSGRCAGGSPRAVPFGSGCTARTVPAACSAVRSPSHRRVPMRGRRTMSGTAAATAASSASSRCETQTRLAGELWPDHTSVSACHRPAQRTTSRTLAEPRLAPRGSTSSAGWASGRCRARPSTSTRPMAKARAHLRVGQDAQQLGLVEAEAVHGGLRLEQDAHGSVPGRRATSRASRGRDGADDATGVQLLAQSPPGVGGEGVAGLERLEHDDVEGAVLGHLVDLEDRADGDGVGTEPDRLVGEQPLAESVAVALDDGDESAPPERRTAVADGRPDGRASAGR